MTKLYTPIEMLQAMEKMPEPNTFLLSTLITKETISDKTNVEIDTVEGSNASAVYSDRNGPANLVNKRGYANSLHVAPYVNEEITFTIGDVLDTVLPGENAYGGMASNRVQVRTAQWLKELNNRLTNLRESQLAAAIQTGQIAVSGAGVSYTVDFNMSASNKDTLSGGNVWTTSSTLILSQLQTWADRLADKGYVASKLLLERSAANLLVNNTVIATMLDNRRITRGEINPQVIAGQRASYLGTLNAPGMNLDIYSYEAKVQTAADTYAGIFTQYRAVMLGEGLEVEQVFCRIDNANTGSFMGRAFPMQYWEPNGKIGHISLESSPMVVIRNPNAIFSAITVS